MINIENIYCINLEDRPDRWKKMQAQFGRLGLNVQRFVAFRGLLEDHNPHRKTLGQLGCLKSHAAILEDAICKGYRQILVLEDDITLCDDFSERLEIYSQMIPNDWDEAYLGGIIFHSHSKLPQHNQYVYRNRCTYGTQAIIIKESIFQPLLQLYRSHKYNADNCHAEYIQRKFNSYIFKPYFFKLNEDISDVIEGEVYGSAQFDRVNIFYKNAL